MANEEEMESFELNERDLFNAFNPGNRRSYKQSKSQQIYGVFGDDDEGEEEATMFSSKKKQKKDYTAPVGFVKGGIQGKSAKPKLVDVSESEEDEEVHPSTSSRNTATKKQPHNTGNSKLQSQQNSGLGDWEKHTKGIGAKLLLQMGYQPGKGLGKALQGRSVPVEAQVRKGRGAVGLYGSEQKTQTVTVSDDEEEKEFRQNLAHWKKGGNNESSNSREKVKTQFVYRTSEQVIEDASKSGVQKMAREYSEISKTKVIDMTGPEERVLSNYSALSIRKTSVPFDNESNINQDKFQFDKLTSNLDVLVNLCEQEIILNDNELTHHQDQVVARESEIKNLQRVLLQEQRDMDVLTRLLQVLDQFEEKRASSSLDLDLIMLQLTDLKKDYPEEYNSHNMANVALTYIIPLIKARLLYLWRPLEDKFTDKSCRLVFQQLRPFLEGCSKPIKSDRRLNRNLHEPASVEMDPYHGVFWHAWMPAFRQLVANKWQCKKADPLVELLEEWKSLLPEWIEENILDQLILPKIQKEVDDWNPLTDLVPIHAWIHPWIPRLGSKLEVVYPTIRQKMAQALVDWVPSDHSARSVLLPWVDVFSKGSMEAFLTKNIVPKLQQVIVQWNINPNQQKLDEWEWIMAWKDLLPTQVMVNMLDNLFFPKWLQVLVNWLNHSPNAREIVTWYTGWKSLFPPEILQHKSIQDRFAKSLDLMNRALVTGVEFVAAPVPVVMTQPVPVAMVQPVGFREIANIRELVELRCAQQGILFVPKNQWQAGRPVFQVGSYLCYFDRQVVFVLLKGMWVPINVQQLLEMASV